MHTWEDGGSERGKERESEEGKRGQWVREGGGGWRKRRKNGESWGEGGEGEKEEIKGMRTGEKTFYTDILHLW